VSPILRPCRPVLSSLFLVLAAAAGCSEATPEGPPDAFGPSRMVPVGGSVTLDRQPLANAVVTFMPEQGATFVGETDDEGHYELAGYDRRGAPPGRYKVAVSYLVSADGEPQGLEFRSGLTMPPSMLSAREQLAREYSDLGRTRLAARVGPEGGRFDFEVKRADAVPATPPPRAVPRDDSGAGRIDGGPAGH
jgi:hypothetical protein